MGMIDEDIKNSLFGEFVAWIKKIKEKIDFSTEL